MLRRFLKMLRASDGMAAVEFAFIAPVMILMFFGAVELTTAVDCRTRVTSVASTAADLVAQETSVSSTDMSNVFAALNAILYPFSSGSSTVTVPTGLIVSGSGGSIILAEITYAYASPTTRVLTGTVSMVNSFYAHPRRSPTVKHT